MKAIRDELDRTDGNSEDGKTLKELRSAGAKKHYEDFVWPRFFGTSSRSQANAKSWIARQRLHPFWEIIHIFIALLGFGLTIAAIVAATGTKEDDAIKVRIVNDHPIDVRTVK